MTKKIDKIIFNYVVSPFIDIHVYIFLEPSKPYGPYIYVDDFKCNNTLISFKFNC